MAIVVLVHLVVSVLHGNAHTSLGVGLNNWQQVYVYIVILFAPLGALVLSFTPHAKATLWLLLVSMLGSLVFGAAYHFVIISPDHVAHLPAGDARAMFRFTAVLLLITEAFGVLVSAALLKQQKSTDAQVS